MQRRTQTPQTGRYYDPLPRTSRQPDTPILKLYRDLSAWHKPLVTLTPAQQGLVLEILEHRFPGIEIHARNLRNAQIVGVLKGAGFIVLVLGILAVIVMLGGPQL